MKKEIQTKPKWEQVALNPIVSAACVIQDYSEFKNISLDELVTELEEVTGFHKNLSSRTEVMLSMQAHILNMIFCRLTSMALNNSHYRIEYLDLALKTQRHCRSTLESLKFIKGTDRKKFPDNELEVNDDGTMDR